MRYFARSGLTFLVAILVPFSSLTAAGPAMPPHFDAGRVSHDIEILASDAFEGRAPASPGEGRSVAYIVAAMKSAGLRPGGDRIKGQRGWTQDVLLARSVFAAEPRVAAGEEALVQRRDIALRAPRNGATRIDLAEAPLVFVGYGVSAPERGWDDFKGLDLHGKIAVVLVNDPDFETGGGDFGGKAMTYYGRWTYKYEEAGRRGAAGVLIVHEDAPAAYGWATVVSSNTGAVFDIARKDAAARYTGLEGWISRDAAVRLFARSGLDFEAEKRRAQSRDFRPAVLAPRLSAQVEARRSTIRTRNVLGLLPGARTPGEHVIYSAHWDHLGIGQADARGDRIYNGAVDNASGVAALLELARAFGKAPRPARSVLFLALAAEEQGLLGSQYYAQAPVYPLATTAGVLNMDGPFGRGAARDFTISGSARLGLLDMLVANGRRQGLAFTPEPHPEAGSFFRSDHFSFAQAGVPAISFKTGIDLVEGGTARGEALDAAYRRDRYHQPADEYAAGWDTGSVTPALSLLYATGRELADGRTWPEWSPDSEFAAVRARSAAARK